MGLLATKARTAEERRLELSDRAYADLHGLGVLKVYEYEKHPNVNIILSEVPGEKIRFYEDGLEAVIDRSFSGPVKIRALLVVEPRKQAIEFSYFLEEGKRKSGKRKKVDQNNKQS